MYSAERGKTRSIGELVAAGAARRRATGCLQKWRVACAALRAASEGKRRGHELMELQRRRQEALEGWLTRWVVRVETEVVQTWRGWAEAREEGRRLTERLTLWADAHLKRRRETLAVTTWALWWRRRVAMKGAAEALERRRGLRALKDLGYAASMARARKGVGLFRVAKAVVAWQAYYQGRKRVREGLACSAAAFAASRTTSSLLNALSTWRTVAKVRGALSAARLALRNRALRRACAQWRGFAGRAREGRAQRDVLDRGVWEFQCRKALRRWLAHREALSWKAHCTSLTAQLSRAYLARAVGVWRGWAARKQAIHASLKACEAALGTRRRLRALAAFQANCLAKGEARARRLAAAQAAASTKAKLLGRTFQLWAQWVGQRRAAKERAAEEASGKVAAHQRKILAAVFSIWKAWAHRNRVVARAGERYSATKGALKARAAVARWRAWRARVEESKARLARIHSACFALRVKGLVGVWRVFARVHGKERRLVAACELRVRRPTALRRAVREWREKGRVWSAARVLHERAVGVLGRVKLTHALLAWTSHTRDALLVAAISSSVREKSLVLRALRGVRLWQESTLLVKRVRKGALILARKLWEAE